MAKLQFAEERRIVNVEELRVCRILIVAENTVLEAGKSYVYTGCKWYRPTCVWTKEH
jgi:hypothetical protein